ncbi:MAG: L,D-transpeptidase [Deltaproteobacteria bacterium]|nr:L,D-transpeptidase [Deltaproteobacteria bacterium]
MALCCLGAGSGLAAVETVEEQTASRLAQPMGLPGAVVTLDRVDSFHVLLVDKSLQTLFLYHYQADGRPEFIGAFPCSTGRGRGGKVREGDRRTPEGIYFFTQVFRDNKVTIFGKTAYHMNYPDPFDRAEKRDGNGIYLHGTNRPLGSRATNGCVVMNNKNLDTLSRHVQLHDTPIIISRRLSWLSDEEFAAERERFRDYLSAQQEELTQMAEPSLPQGARLLLQRAVLLREGGRVLVSLPVVTGEALAGWRRVYLARYPGQPQILARIWQPLESYAGVKTARTRPSARKEILDLLQSWVQAWESRDVDRYMAFYSKKFRAYGMSYRQWRAYKTRLTREYSAIDIQISDIQIKIRGQKALARFRQAYVSDKFEDVGHKTLRLSLEGERWKIRREDWRPLEIVEFRP